MKFSVLRLLIITALVAILVAGTCFVYANTEPLPNVSSLEHAVKSLMTTIVTCMVTGAVIVGIGGLSYIIEQAIYPKPKEEEEKE